MAVVNAYPFRTTERESIMSAFRLSFGASGAPTLERGKDISTIVRDSTGLYTLTLKEKFFALLAFDPTLLDASVSGLKVELAVVTMTSKTIQFRVVGPTGAGDTTPVVTDPASGSELYVSMLLSNTSLSY